MVQGVDPSHLIGLVQDEEEDEEEEVDEGDMFDYKKCGACLFVHCCYSVASCNTHSRVIF